jgi:hypothetical protein
VIYAEDNAIAVVKDRLSLNQLAVHPCVPVLARRYTHVVVFHVESAVFWRDAWAL